MEEDKSQIIITWNRETGQVNYDLKNMSHVEAQRILLAISQANFDDTLTELSCLHTHEEQG